jgi:hypothetical protein
MKRLPESTTALRLVPDLPEATPSLAPQVRARVMETLTPQSLRDRLTGLQQTLAKDHLDLVDVEAFLDDFQRFLSQPPTGGFGVGPMAIGLFRDLEMLVAERLAGNMIDAMTGQSANLRNRLESLSPQVDAFVEKANEDSSRLLHT